MAGCLAAPRLLPTQAEKALFNAAIEGDLATLSRLVEEGVDLEATDNGDDEDQVSATSPASNPIPLCRLCPLPLLAPHSPRVCRRRRAVRRRASRPSCMRLTAASSTASTTSSPVEPTLRPQARCAPPCQPTYPQRPSAPRPLPSPRPLFVRECHHRRRASADGCHGPILCNHSRRARLPRAPHRQARQRERHR